MRGRRRARGLVRLLGCDEAVEAVSARMDGEPAPVAQQDLETHLASCTACREFEARAAGLRRHVGLMPTRAFPDDLMAKLVPLVEPSGRPLHKVLGRRFAPGTGPEWAVAAGWAGATFSVALVAAALSLGVGQHPHLVPSRPLSPCTAGLPHPHFRGPLPRRPPVAR